MVNGGIWSRVQLQRYLLQSNEIMYGNRYLKNTEAFLSYYFCKHRIKHGGCRKMYCSFQFDVDNQ
jgi:hypothetical protein